MSIETTMLLFIEKGMFSSCLQPGAVSTIVSSVVNCGHSCASTACSWHSAIATHSSSIAGRSPQPPCRPIAGSQSIRRLLRACHLFNKITSEPPQDTKTLQTKKIGRSSLFCFSSNFFLGSCKSLHTTDGWSEFQACVGRGAVGAPQP